MDGQRLDHKAYIKRENGEMEDVQYYQSRSNSIITATTAERDSVQIHDQSGAIRGTFTSTRSVDCFTQTKDGKHVITGCLAGYLHIFRLEHSREAEYTITKINEFQCKPQDHACSITDHFVDIQSVSESLFVSCLNLEEQDRSLVQMWRIVEDKECKDEEKVKNDQLPERTFTQFPGTIFTIACNNDVVVAGGVSNNIYVWSTHTGHLQAKLMIDTKPQPHLPELSTLVVKISPDGARVASSGEDGIIRIWSLQGSLLDSWDRTKSQVNDLVWQTNGHVFSARQDGKVYLWDIESQRETVVIVEKGSLKKIDVACDGCIATMNDHTDGVNLYASEPFPGARHNLRWPLSCDGKAQCRCQLVDEDLDKPFLSAVESHPIRAIAVQWTEFRQLKARIKAFQKECASVCSDVISIYKCIKEICDRRYQYQEDINRLNDLLSELSENRRSIKKVVFEPKVKAKKKQLQAANAQDGSNSLDSHTDPQWNQFEKEERAKNIQALVDRRKEIIRRLKDSIYGWKPLHDKLKPWEEELVSVTSRIQVALQLLQDIARSDFVVFKRQLGAQSLHVYEDLMSDFQRRHTMMERTLECSTGYVALKKAAVLQGQAYNKEQDRLLSFESGTNEEDPAFANILVLEAEMITASKMAYLSGATILANLRDIFGPYKEVTSRIIQDLPGLGGPFRGMLDEHRYCMQVLSQGLRTTTTVARLLSHLDSSARGGVVTDLFEKVNKLDTRFKKALRRYTCKRTLEELGEEDEEDSDTVDPAPHSTTPTKLCLRDDPSDKHRQDSVLRKLRENLKKIRKERDKVLNQLVPILDACPELLVDQQDGIAHGPFVWKLKLPEIDIQEIDDCEEKHSCRHKVFVGSFGTARWALKQCHLEVKDHLKAFRKELEIRAIAGKHANLMSVEAIVYEVDTSALYLAMTWMPYTLDSWCWPQTGDVPSEALKHHVILQICAGVRHLHLQRIVHDDLKPANILVNERNFVKITDFGHSRSKETNTTVTYPVSRSFSDPLKSQYDETDYFFDIYSLGCCIYSMFYQYPEDPKRREEYKPNNTYDHQQQQQLSPKERDQPFLIGMDRKHKHLQAMLCDMILEDPEKRPLLVLSDLKITTYTRRPQLLDQYAFMRNPPEEGPNDKGMANLLLGPDAAPWKLSGLPWKKESPNGIEHLVLVPPKNDPSDPWMMDENEVSHTNHPKLMAFIEEHYRSCKDLILDHTSHQRLNHVILIRQKQSQAAFFEKIIKLSTRYSLDQHKNNIDTEGVPSTPELRYLFGKYPPISLTDLALGPNSPLGSKKNIQLLRVYHGVPSKEIAFKIFKEGFIVKCERDPGWYGQGAYVSPDPQCAMTYGNFLIAYDLIIGRTFPVTDQTHRGQAIQPSFDSHIAIVDLYHYGTIASQTEWSNPGTSIEIVVSETSQLLPRGILDFSMDGCTGSAATRTKP